MLASFLNSSRHAFDLRQGDEGNLAYLACTSPSWLLVPSLSGPKYTYYSAYRVLRQFGFDQDILLVFKEVVPSLPSLDAFLRLQAFSYWSKGAPNSWRQTLSGKSLLVVALLVTGKIGRVYDPSFFSTSSYNKCLALPIAGIVFAAISSKIGFAEWHASRGGWVCYANDFPDAWSGCDLIMGSSSGVPIKRGVIEVIGVATPVGKGKEKKIKQKAVKKSEVKGSAEGIKVGHETKKRKTAKSCK